MRNATFLILSMLCGFPSIGTAAPDTATLDALRRIVAPRIVGVPPENACRGMMVMPDGEIRHYGFRVGPDKSSQAVQTVYLSSRDCGLSWREVPVSGPTAGAMVRSPWSGDFLTILCKPRHFQHESWQTSLADCEGSGFFVFRSAEGPEGPWTHALVNRQIGLVARQPLALRQRRRWVQPIQHPGQSPFTCKARRQKRTPTAS